MATPARVLTLLGALVAARAANPCCAVGPNDHIQFTNQQSLVIWDEASHTEHFIRNASFDATGADFAFIAPTPSKPDMEIVNGTVFKLLSHAISFPPDSPIQPKSDIGAVEVVQEKQVGKFDTVTVAATDTTALMKWLSGHGYKVNKEATAWMEHYVSKHWMFTAFKVNASRTNVETGPVRMSFKTDQPFCPYLVPNYNRGSASHTLGLIFVGASPVTVTEGQTKPWKANGDYAEIAEDTIATVARMLKLRRDQLPEHAYGAKFWDTNFGLGADDLFFHTSLASRVSSNKMVRPILVIVLLAGFLGWQLRRHRRSAAQSPLE